MPEQQEYIGVVIGGNGEDVYDREVVTSATSIDDAALSICSMIGEDEECVSVVRYDIEGYI